MDNAATAEKKLPFPTAAMLFLFIYSLGLNFYYYGFQAILVIFLNTKLNFSEKASKSLFHAIPMLAYFLPIFGAILADTWLGKFNTIMTFLCVFAVGAGLLQLGSFTNFNVHHIPLVSSALIIMASGNGMCKACTMPLIGDQFVLPDQQKQLVFSFGMMYLLANVASLGGTFLTPLLRSEFDCFGEIGCYPLAFGIPTTVLVIGIAMFMIGRCFYVIINPDKAKGNLIVNVTKCIYFACSHLKEPPPVNHWLDRSKPKYGDQMVNDIKALGRVFVVYLPLPIYYALYYQQASAWILQGAKMDGDVGFYMILPEQMQLVNPLLVVVMIPLFEHAIYPVLNKCHILTTPLQKMCTGGFITAGTFIISGFVSLALEDSDPILPGVGESHLRIYDPTDCHYNFLSTENSSPEGVAFDQMITDSDYSRINIPGTSISDRPVNGYFEALNFPLKGESDTVQVTFTSDKRADCHSRNMSITLKEAEAFYMYISYDGVYFLSDAVEKSHSGKGLVRTIFARKNESVTYEYRGYNAKSLEFKVNGNITTSPELEKVPKPGGWVLVNDKPRFTSEVMNFRLSATYVVLVDTARKSVRMITMLEASSVHILWQLPQFTLLTVGEVLFAIAALEFAYAEAPASMKAIVQALFMLTTSLGNLIVLVIEQCNVLKKQSHTFFLYSGLMGIDLVCFTILAIRYKYANPPTGADENAENT